MLFNSLQFLLFFVVVTGLYFSLGPGPVGLNGRWRLLLTASCYFYMVFKPAYILILALTIVIDYGAGLWIERTQAPGARRWLLILSLVTNLGILAFFKYLAFFTGNITFLFSSLHLPDLAHTLDAGTNRVFLKVLRFFGESGIQSFKEGASILPIGLSFHTFQAMSYTIEVYRGKQRAERHFGIYALYVMFYPQLVAGPIERPQNVLHQFHTYFPYDFEQVKAGLMRMAFGFFKKVVIADRLALVVAQAYGDPAHQNGLTLLVATFFFTFQIYCDFSGYSDIAIGAARVMGFSLMENFNTPYIAGSVSDFWRRWHISLSTWFRDYLYIPLGGNRHGEFRKNLNLMLVFLASGLWHGANWTYVIWGGLNGFYQIVGTARDRLLNRPPTSRSDTLPTTRSRIGHGINVLTTFGLIMLTWVFFRARSVSDALLILRRIAGLSFRDVVSSPLNGTEMWFSIGLIGLLLVKEQFLLTIPTRNTARFYVLFALIVFLTYFFGVFTSNQFIYFQF